MYAKNVVSEIDDPATDILPEAASKYKKMAAPGDIVEIPIDTKKFGRIAAQTVKHVIRQGIKEAGKRSDAPGVPEPSSGACNSKSCYG